MALLGVGGNSVGSGGSSGGSCGSSDGSCGSSGGSLVATIDFKPAVPGSNPGISPAYSGLPVLRWAAFWDGNFTVCPLRGGRGLNKQKDLWSTKMN